MKNLLYTLLLLLLVSCGKKEDKAEGGPEAGKEAAANTSLSKAEAPEKIIAVGRIEPEAKIASLATEVAGVVKKLYAKEGDRVAAGQVLAEMNNDVELAKVNQLRAKLATQQNQITTDKAQLENANIKTTNLRRTYERTKKLFEGGAETRQTLDNAETDMLASDKDVARLQSQVKASESKLLELQADTRVNEAEYERRFLRAPTAGKILQLDAKPGSAVSQNQAYAEFAPEGAITALCEVDELFSGKVAPGLRAYVRPQGGTDTLAVGTVIYTAAQLKKKSLFSGLAGEQEDRRVREVRIRLENAEGLLYNARVECVIFLKK